MWTNVCEGISFLPRPPSQKYGVLRSNQTGHYELFTPGYTRYLLSPGLYQEIFMDHVVRQVCIYSLEKNIRTTNPFPPPPPQHTPLMIQETPRQTEEHGRRPCWVTSPAHDQKKGIASLFALKIENILQMGCELRRIF